MAGRGVEDGESHKGKGKKEKEKRAIVVMADGERMKESAVFKRISMIDAPLTVHILLATRAIDCRQERFQKRLALADATDVGELAAGR